MKIQPPAPDGWAVRWPSIWRDQRYHHRRPRHRAANSCERTVLTCITVAVANAADACGCCARPGWWTMPSPSTSLLAVTPSDAVNMSACQLAPGDVQRADPHRLHRSTEYHRHDPQFLAEHFGVEFAIQPGRYPHPAAAAVA